MKTRAAHVLLLMVISGLIGYYVGVSKVSVGWKNYQPSLSVVNKEAPSAKNVDFTRFWTVWNKLEDQYYDKSKLDPEKMLDGAIMGMVEGLEDPYTMYLPPTQNDSFKDGMAGKFEGIGAELGLENKQVIVVAPIAGSPAEKAGIRPGDAIVKVDNANTMGWTLSQTVGKIRGPKGTTVKLAVVHKDEEKLVDISIVRDTITIKSVEGWVKKATDIKGIKIDANKSQGSIAYIRLSQFGDNTNAEWVAAVNTIVAEMRTNNTVKGVVLDLRNNPGGYLSEAAFIASEFVKSGVVVSKEGGNTPTEELRVERRGLLLDIPVIVLINKGSASASEIVAGALRDHKRAKLVGETSFGKGTIQTAEDLGKGSGVHITIAKWLTPNKTWVHGVGLTPDITVALDPAQPDRDLQLEKAVTELLQ